MITLNTIQVILLCIACLSFGFAAGYTLKCMMLDGKETNYPN